MVDFSPLPWGEGGESSEPGEGLVPKNSDTRFVLEVVERGETPTPLLYPPLCEVRGGGLTTAMGKRVKATRAAAGSSTFTCTV